MHAIAEGKLNQYRRKSDSVDLSLEAKSVLDQIVNVDNQLNELTDKIFNYNPKEDPRDPIFGKHDIKKGDEKENG